MQKEKFRLIIDTNLWISYLIEGNFKELDGLIISRKVILLYCLEIIEELIEVSQRDKFRKFFTVENVLQLLSMIEEYGEVIEVKSGILECRDPKDDFLLSLAKDGKADFLLTGDSDLLVIQRFENTRIITFPNFISNLDDSEKINLEDLIVF